MMDAIVERLLSNIMKVKTSLEQDFSPEEQEGTDKENRVQSEPTEVEVKLCETKVPEATPNQGTVILNGNAGIVFTDRDKLHIKRLKWLYGKRFKNI